MGSECRNLYRRSGCHTLSKAWEISRKAAEQ
jgi:hypothetical protein